MVREEQYTKENGYANRASTVPLNKDRVYTREEEGIAYLFSQEK